jgi:hypothetical protein
LFAAFGMTAEMKSARLETLACPVYGAGMFKITMRARGISPKAGPAAAKEIEDEFREHRPWHEDVTCSFSDGTLVLVAFNDFDPDGLALSDEFSDCLAAYLAIGEIDDDGEFEVAAAETV